jgi:hypothetical protein
MLAILDNSGFLERPVGLSQVRSEQWLAARLLIKTRHRGVIP